MKNLYTFTAREYDSETGLYYYRARYYDPVAGRFITRDPIGFEGGINQYAYVLNNPVNYTDPEGLNPAAARTLALALAAARTAKIAIEKGANYCKNIRCKIAVHGPHHYFGWPINKKMSHVQLNCWIKGVKGSKFVLRFPYSSSMSGAGAAGAGGLPDLPNDDDNLENQE